MEKKKEGHEKQDFIKFLKEKKAKDGRLSKLGEWLLSGKGKQLGWKILPDDMKYILR